MPATDSFDKHHITLESPVSGGQAVITSDDSAAQFQQVTRALYIGAAGDAVVVLPGEVELTFKALNAGQMLPVRAVRVKATGTTATDIVALW